LPIRESLRRQYSECPFLTGRAARDGEGWDRERRTKDREEEIGVEVEALNHTLWEELRGCEDGSNAKVGDER
jgi:hypothetical protein